MDQNEAHKERMAPGAGDPDAGAGLVATVRTELAALEEGATENDVRAALERAGVAPAGIQVLTGYGSIRFGATYDGGADQIADCIYGEVAGTTVTVDTGGLVADGGCLAMDGH
jgi:hypothetical protein